MRHRGMNHKGLTLDRRMISGALAVFVAGLLPAAASAAQGGGVKGMRSAALDLVDRQIRELFDDVQHMSMETFLDLLRTDPDRIVLLDVRGAEEHAVSHLEGAVHISPDERSVADVVQRAGDIDGKIVIAYCSIGLRSSRLIVRLGQALKERGAAELHNLAGGVFRWRNDGRLLLGPMGPTRAIHPYSVLWRQFLLEDPAGDATRSQ